MQRTAEGNDMTEEEWLTSPDPAPMMEQIGSARKRWLFALACADRIVHLLPDEEFVRAHAIVWQAVDEEWDANKVRDLWPIHPNHPITHARAWIGADATSPEHALAVAQEAAAFAVWEFGRDLNRPFLSVRVPPPRIESIIAEEAALAQGAEAFAISGPELALARVIENAEFAIRRLDRQVIRSFFDGQDFAQAIFTFRTEPTVRTAHTFAVLAGYARARSQQADLLRDIFGNPFRPVTIASEWRTSDVILLARGIHADRAFDRMPILADALQDAGCDDEGILSHCRGCGFHVRGCWVVDAILGRS
jgi:hypothetical protein